MNERVKGGLVTVTSGIKDSICIGFIAPVIECLQTIERIVIVVVDKAATVLRRVEVLDQVVSVNRDVRLDASETSFRILAPIMKQQVSPVEISFSQR
jgi:hypothetical protein